MPFILSILASPKLKGQTATLLEHAENAMRQNGVTVQRINISTQNIHPCIACMRCRNENQCSLPEDDATSIAQLIKEADGIIIAAPTYWGGIPGILKMLFDRMVYALIDTSSPHRLSPIPLHRGKPAAMIISSTAPWPANILSYFTDTTGDLRRILRPSGFKILSPLIVGNTRKYTSVSKQNVLKAERLGKRMATAII